MSTLAQFRARIAQALVDTSNVNFATAAIDEALRTALHEYTMVAPLTAESLLTLPGAGRTVALNELTDLLAVRDLWWPYDSAEDDDVNQAANRVIGFRLRFDDAQPLVLLTTLRNEQPQLDDELYVWWTKPQAIQDLDSAVATTIPIPHESGLIVGASGYAAISRAIDLTEAYNQRRAASNIESWGWRQISTFKGWLNLIRASTPAAPAKTYGTGWQLDKWDV